MAPPAAPAAQNPQASSRASSSSSSAADSSTKGTHPTATAGCGADASAPPNASSKLNGEATRSPLLPAPHPRPHHGTPPTLLPPPTKRRRVATATTSTSSSPWSSMPGDLVEHIAERVLAGDPVDYVRLRASCRHWRACTADPRGRGVSDPRFHPRRWMILPEGHGLYPGHAKLRGRVRFFNRVTGAFVGVHLPLFADHAALDCPDGLLLLQRDADTAVRLLNPFTGDIVDLPPLRSLLPQLYKFTPPQPRLGDDDNLRYFRRVCAAISVAPVTGAITVLLPLENCNRFAHACATDRSWTLASWSLKAVGRAMAFHGSLYMVYHGATTSILRLDPPTSPLNVDDNGSSSSPVVLPQPQTIATLPSNLMILPQLVDRTTRSW